MDALKALLSGGRVIAFYPELARKLGGITEAIMLQQFMHWAKANPDEWFWHTQEQIEEETTIKKDAQQAIRKRLADKGVLEEKREGLPARMYFRLNWDAITALLSADDPSPSSGQIPQQEEVSDRNIKKNNEMKERDDIDAGEILTIYETAHWFAKKVGGIVPTPKSREWAEAKRLVSIGMTERDLNALFEWLRAQPWVTSISLGLMAMKYNDWKSTGVVDVPPPAKTPQEIFAEYRAANPRV